MQIVERRTGQVVVIDWVSEPNLRGRYDDFQRLVRERVKAGDRHFVINLAQCHWIDSLGLGELIRSLTHVLRQGGQLKLACLAPKIKTVLTITRLIEVFEVCDDEAAALRSFSS